MKKLIGMISVVMGMAIITFGFGGTSDAATNTQVGNSIDGVNDSHQTVDKKADAVNHIVQEAGETEDGHKIMEYIIQNNSSADVTLNYGTSMKYDYYILNEQGKEIYRNSDHNMYNLVLTSLEVEAGETETFQIELPILSAGEYTMVLTPAAKGDNNEQTAAQLKID